MAKGHSQSVSREENTCSFPPRLRMFLQQHALHSRRTGKGPLPAQQSLLPLSLGFHPTSLVTDKLLTAESPETFNSHRPPAPSTSLSPGLLDTAFFIHLFWFGFGQPFSTIFPGSCSLPGS